jgi:hypothetical protein
MKAFIKGQTRRKNNILRGTEVVISIGIKRSARAITPHQEVFTHSPQLWHWKATAGPAIIFLTREMAGLLQCGQRYIPGDFKLKLPQESIADRWFRFSRLVEPGVADVG